MVGSVSSLSAKHAKNREIDEGVNRKTVDRSALRSALGRYTTGVTIVTAIGSEERPVGVTANSFASVSLEPPLVLWSLSRRSPNLGTFRDGGRFAINVLARDQADLSLRFAQPIENKFAGVSWFPAATGCPILTDHIAWFDCRLTAAHDGGDHLIFIGEVAAFDLRPGAPLIFRDGAYTCGKRS